MNKRFQISLTEQDFRALRKLADREYREPRQMAGFLIREGLENRGLLASGKDEPARPDPQQSKKGIVDGR